VIIYFNGSLVEQDRARVSPFDRGFLFGDALYEGLRAFRGQVVGLDAHVRRMDAGLREARIAWKPERLGSLTSALLEANALRDAFVYWQVSRGTPSPGQPVRSRAPAGPMSPTVFGYCVPTQGLESYAEPLTATAIVAPDLRWGRGHVKSTSLMGNILSCVQASEHGAHDVVFVRGELVAEGSASNVILAVPEGPGVNGASTRLVTPSLDSVSILDGVTRRMILAKAPEIEVRAVSRRELERASEVILVGSTAMVTSVLRLDERVVGEGKAGPKARRLMRLLIEAIDADVGSRAPVAACVP
jgi:D-alanine transaminase